MVSPFTYLPVGTIIVTTLYLTLPVGIIIVTSLYFVESGVRPVEFAGPVIYGQPIHLPSCRYHHSYNALFNTYLPVGTVVVTSLYFVESGIRPVEFRGIVIYGQSVHLPSCWYHRSYNALFNTYLSVSTVIATSLYFVKSGVRPVEFTGPVIYGQSVHLPSQQCWYHHSYNALFNTYLPVSTVIATSRYFVKSGVRPVEFTSPVIYGQSVHLPSCWYHGSYITLFNTYLPVAPIIVTMLYLTLTFLSVPS